MEREPRPEDETYDPATGVDPNTSDVRGGPRSSTTSDPGRRDPIVPGEGEAGEGGEESGDRPAPEDDPDAPWPPVRP